MQSVEEKIEKICEGFPSPKSKRFHIILFTILGVICVAFALAIILPLTLLFTK